MSANFKSFAFSGVATVSLAKEHLIALLLKVIAPCTLADIATQALNDTGISIMRRCVDASMRRRDY
ncbi:MAG: hypothetical protein ACR5K7_04530 [Symbiopectobacterium sp.]